MFRCLVQRSGIKCDPSIKGSFTGLVRKLGTGYLLLCVAVFQTPLILSKLWKSIHPCDLSESKLS
jgi:hypothetical protein